MIFSAPVDFHIADDPDLQAKLREKAVEIDDRENAQHQASYTVEQAFTVVWHQEPEWLVETGILYGWVVEKPGLWPPADDPTQWIDTPEEAS